MPLLPGSSPGAAGIVKMPDTAPTRKGDQLTVTDTSTLATEYRETAVYDVRDYGATPDHPTSADQSAFIQAAIDAANLSDKNGVVEIPPGDYTCNAGLVFRKSPFSNITIRGSGAYPYDAGIGQITRLIFTDATDFGIGIHQGKGVTIEGIYFQGQNSISFASPRALCLADEATDFVAAGVRDNQYSPHAAIVIDPFGSTSIAAGDQYPNHAAEYTGSPGAGGSTIITIKNCRWERWVCGVIISPADTANADHVEINNCRGDTNKVSVAVCQSQSRNVLCNRLTCAGPALRMFDGSSYGAGSGPVPHTVNCQTAGLVKYAMFSGGWPTHVAQWTGFHMESCYALGRCAHPINFTSCLFKSSPSLEDPATWFTNTSRFVKFTSCELITSAAVPDANRSFTLTGRGISFETCVFDLAPFVVPTFNVFGATSLYGAKFDRCFELGTGDVLDNRTELFLGVDGQVEAITIDTVTPGSGTTARTATFETAGGIWTVGDQITSRFLIDDEYSGSPEYVVLGQISAIDGTTVTLRRCPPQLTTGSAGTCSGIVFRHKGQAIDAKGGPFTSKDIESSAWKGIGLRQHGNMSNVLSGLNDDIVLDIDYKVQKSTSGEDTGLRVNKQPLAGNSDDSYLLDLTVNSGSQLAVSENADIRIKEKADHELTAAAGYGLLWVKSDAPCTLQFTDDAGTDHDLTAGGGAFTADAATQITPSTAIVLDEATGNEIALDLSYTVNKATSGNDTGLRINQIDTLSPGTSLPLDVQVGGTRKAALAALPGSSTFGALYLGAATPTNSNYTLTSDNSTTYLYGSSSVQLFAGALNRRIKIDNSPAAVAFGSAFVSVHPEGTTTTLGAAANPWTSLVLSGPTYLHGDAANQLALRNGTNAQAFHVYNTDDGLGNYERGVFKWDTNVLTIGPENGGTGSNLRNIDIKTSSGATRIKTASGTVAQFNNLGLRVETGACFHLTGGDLGYSNVPWGNLHMNGAINPRTYSAASGTDQVVKITPTYNQTGTAGSTDLLINRTETSLGSGTHLLADFQVGGSSVLSIGNGSEITIVGLPSNDPAAANQVWVGGNVLQISDGTDLKNIGVGYLTLAAITTGYENTALGYGAGYQITDGYRNVLLGSSSGNSLTTGKNNVAAGWRSLFTNASGQYNMALGFQSLYTATGSDNVGIGKNAGFAISSGSNNVAIGTDTAVDSPTGSNQININNRLYYGSNVFDVRNGTNAQSFHVYGTADGTPGSNYRRLEVKAVDAAGDFAINATGLGTGLSPGNTLTLQTDGTEALHINASQTIELGVVTTPDTTYAIDLRQANDSSFKGLRIQDNSETSTLYLGFQGIQGNAASGLELEATAGDVMIAATGTGDDVVIEPNATGEAYVTGDFRVTGDTTVGPIINASVTPANAAGAIEFDGNTLFFTPVADDRSFMLADGIITSDTTVANTVTETTVYTESFSANELHVGQVVRVHMLGRYSTANGTDTFTLRMKIGGTTVDSVVSVGGVVTDAPVTALFTFTVRSVGVSGTVFGFCEAVFDSVHNDQADTSTTTVDTTGANDVIGTVQWSAANASNTFTLSQGWTELVN